MNINGTNEALSNVTLGEAIPRLVQQAESNFSIPLSGSAVLARFNAANLTCESENALVTFDGSAEHVVEDSATTTSSASAAALATAIARRDSTTNVWTETSYSVATSILHAGTSTALVPASATAAPAANFVVTQGVLDFARIAVLYVLQEDEVNNAITAQSEIQRFFSVSMHTNAAANVSLGNGNVINFIDLTVDVGQGAVGNSRASRTAKRSGSGAESGAV